MSTFMFIPELGLLPSKCKIAAAIPLWLHCCTDLPPTKPPAIPPLTGAGNILHALCRGGEDDFYEVDEKTSSRVKSAHFEGKISYL